MTPVSGLAPPASTPSTFPVGDWQFWVVSLIALVALAWLLRSVLPIPFLARRRARRKGAKRVRITIDGQSVK